MKLQTVGEERSKVFNTKAGMYQLAILRNDRAAVVWLNGEVLAHGKTRAAAVRDAVAVLEHFTELLQAGPSIGQVDPPRRRPRRRG